MALELLRRELRHFPLAVALVLAPSLHAAAADQAPSVSVRVAGSAPAASQIEVALADAMQRLGVALRTERTAVKWHDIPQVRVGEETLVARLFIDLTQSSKARLLVVDDHHERVFVRELRITSGFDEVALEQLVLTVQSSIEAIVAGQKIGVARLEYEAGTQPIRQGPRANSQKLTGEPRRWAVPFGTIQADSRWLGSISGGYTLSVLGPGAIVQGPSLGLALERLPFGLALHVLGRLPMRVGDEVTTLRLTSLGFRGRGWGTLRWSTNVALVGGLGLGSDFTQVAPRGPALGPSMAVSPYWAADGVLQGFVGVAYRQRSWTLRGSLGADVAAQAVRYVTEAAETERDVFTPARIRPFVEIELCARLLQ